MQLTGVQFYWIVAIGLIAGLAIGVPLRFFSDEFNSSGPLLKVVVLALLIFPSICYYTVLVELWQRFRFKAVIFVVVCGLMAAWVHPFFMLVFSLGPVVYWFSRIQGLPDVDNGT